MNETSFDRIVCDLALRQELICVSIYLPLLRGEFVGEQNPTRIKNLLAAAESALVARGLRSVVARDLAQAILAQTEEPGFWKQGGQGLAIFATTGRIEIYRLPQPTAERSVVGRHFNITPLLPLETDGSLIILELSKHDCRALRAHRFSLEELAVPDLPVAGTKGAVDHQRHMSMHGAGRHGTQRQAVFTGQSEPPDRSKYETVEHFRLVNAAMREFLSGGVEPMVIAALPSLAPIYRRVNTYEHLEIGSIDADPNSLSDHELHRQAWKIVEPHFQIREQRLLQDCVRRAKQDPSAFTLPKILLAAFEGRVATLLVATDATCWGTFDPAGEQFRLTDQHAPAAEDLLNLAAVETLRHRGRVFATDLASAGIHELAAAEFKFDDSAAPAGPAAARHPWLKDAENSMDSDQSAQFESER